MSAFSVSLLEMGYGSYPLTLLERVVHMACAKILSLFSGKEDKNLMSFWKTS